MNARFARCVVHLKDGRAFDLSGLTSGEAWARLVAARVSCDDVGEMIVELASYEQVEAAEELERRAVQ